MAARKKQIGKQIEVVVSDGIMSESELERRYDELLSLVLRTGAWLTANSSDLKGAAWEGAFAEYRETLRALQALREELQLSAACDDERVAA